MSYMNNKTNGYYTREGCMPTPMCASSQPVPTPAPAPVQCCTPVQPPVQCCTPVKPNVLQTSCCCKQAMKYSLDLLLNEKIKPLIDLGTFELIGMNFATYTFSATVTTPPSKEYNTTQLKTIPTCSDGLITYKDGSNFTATTVSDLIAFSFKLQPTNIYDSQSNIQALGCCVRNLIPPVNPRCLCCTEETGCCNNVSKALMLSDALADISIKINSSNKEINTISGLEVITVAGNIAWFYDATNEIVYVICLDSIVQIG